MKQYHGGKLKSTIKDMYERFPLKGEVDFDTYKQVISVFNLIMASTIIETGHTYKWPFGLGNIGVYKYKSKNKYATFQNVYTDDHGKYLTHSFKHSEGYRVRWYWNKRKAYGATFNFTSLWRIRLNRNVKRTLAQQVLEKNLIPKYYNYYDQRTIYVN